ncbi:hypothetical protein [Effusibacillus consociatus]|uniref:Uncharacterized protein n=1 Tax=Effusibacillus consociatus TaxID=1117041 RepID=A0ABV9Q696_9BACL
MGRIGLTSYGGEALFSILAVWLLPAGAAQFKLIQKLQATNRKQVESPSECAAVTVE